MDKLSVAYSEEVSYISRERSAASEYVPVAKMFLKMGVVVRFP